MSAFLDLGIGAGPILLGSIAEAVGLSWAFGAAAGIAFVGSLWTLVLSRRSQEVKAPPRRVKSQGTKGRPKHPLTVSIRPSWVRAASQSGMRSPCRGRGRCGRPGSSTRSVLATAERLWLACIVHTHPYQSPSCWTSA